MTEGRPRVSHESESKLGALRSELDGIDAQLLDLVRDRIDVCSRVALVKREFDIPMMQPGRIGLVTERARDYAADNDLSPDFLESVYRLFIAEACRVENLIIDAPRADADAHPDGSR